MIPAPERLPILETSRLRLQPLVLDDAPLVRPLLDDPEVMAFWDVPAIDDPDLAGAIVRNQVEDMAAGQALHWVMRRLRDESFVGCCSLSAIDGWRERGEVGFILAREAWGQGYALEAMHSVVALAAASGLRKLAARTHLGHRASEKLLEKLGFRQEGLLRGHIVRDGERRDCRIFGLLL